MADPRAEVLTNEEGCNRVERLARERLIALCASEAARADLERELASMRTAVAFWEQVR